MPVRELKLSLDTSVLRDALGLTVEELPDNATDEQISQVLASKKAASPPPASEPGNPLTPKAEEKKDDKKDDTPSKTASVHQVPGGLVVDADMWAQTQEELRAVRADREKRERDEDADFIRANVRKGKFPGARADHYMTLMQADREGTREFIDNLPEGLPVTEMGNLGGLDDALKASDYPDSWLTPAERRRVKVAAAAYKEGNIGDVEPGSIIREA